jgi:cytochrome c-type biogenesis protein
MDFTQSGFLLQIAAAFGGGLIAFVSPCVLPMLPGYLGMMSGYSVSDLRSGEVSRWRMLRVTGLFVLGFTLVFVATGAAATQVARVLNSNLRLTNRISGALVLGFGILMVAMAFSNRGFFGALNRERRVEVRPSRLGSWAPPVMGMAFGFGWTPCIGPILGGILGLAATRDTVGQGMMLLFVFSLGLGVPFILAGLGLSKVFKATKSFGKWMRPVNVASGVLMAAFGLVLLTGNLGQVSNWFANVFESIPFLRGLSTV